eukprot:GHUV01037287.1.p1 GENE.GHUV01037287.1~~GHUV01037287.1.p1  ORF type:complete len:714 (+),score=230.60 GHUV01037287.1:420-2561(+)
MNQSRSRRLLDAQAKLIAKEDKKFVAKLAGQKWSDKDSRENARSTTASPSNNTKEQPRPATVDSSLHALQPGHSLRTGAQPHGASKQRTGSPVSRVAPVFEPPDPRPAWLRASTAPEIAEGALTGDDVFTAEPFAAEAQEDAPADGHHLREPGQSSATAAPPPASVGDYSVASTPAQATTWLPYAETGTSQQRVESAYLAAARGRVSSTAAGNTDYRPGSPAWLQKAAATGFWVQPGPIQMENSLYANWATSYKSADSTAAAAGADAASAPAVPATSALAARTGVAEHGTSSPVPNFKDQQQWTQPLGPAAGGTVATVGASSPAVVRASSPADPRRAAATAGQGPNARYQGWLKQQFPGVKPPKREDTESLAQWLEQQLMQLMMQQQTHGANLALQGTHGLLTASPVGRLTSAARPESVGPSTMRLTSTAATSGNGAELQQSWGETGLEQQTSQMLLLAQGADGALDVNLLQQQEAIYSAAFHELCRQVSVGCVERGHLMAQLWLSLRTMLIAALEDRQTAHAAQAAAHAAAAAVREEVDQLRTLQEDEKVALRAISERHAAKAEAAQQQTEQYKQKCDKLQDLLERLSAAQHLVQRVFDLEKEVSDRDTTIKRLGNQVTSLEEQIADLTGQVQTWEKRALAAEAVRQGLEEQLECSTPRPRRDLGLLSDMLTQTEQQMVEQALVAGRVWARGLEVAVKQQMAFHGLAALTLS